jgi:hypothetical protein
VQRRKRQAPEEGLAGEPDHHIGILAERPQQGETLEARKTLAEDEDALCFELAEAIHARVSRRRRVGAEKNRLAFGRSAVALFQAIVLSW